mgnify:CR=1 FL=1
MRDYLLDILEKNKMLPRSIAVKKGDLFTLLHPLAIRLGITLQLCKNLPAINDVRRNMAEYFRR